MQQEELGKDRNLRRLSTACRALVVAGIWGVVLWSGTAHAGDNASAQDAPQQDVPKWGPWLDLEGKWGTERSLGEADAFLPLLQDDDTLFFGNAKFRLDDNDSLEGNLGLGLRQMIGGGWNLGGYGYIDRRRSEHHFVYHQITFGAEALGADFDLRANAYWPVGDTVNQVDGLNRAYLSGTTIFLRGGEEHALRGFDAEVGWRVPLFDAEGPLDLRLYAGGFTFEDPDDSDVPDITGPRLRAEFVSYETPYLWEGARLTLGAEWQHDDVRGSQGFASLRLRIPLQAFGGGSARPRLTAQERRMAAPVVRDVDIVAQADAFGDPEVVTETAEGSPITVLSSASTTGAQLPTAVAAAGANSTVILTGSFDTTASTTLQSGQTLLGAGTTVVRAPSGRTAPLTTFTATVAGSINDGSAVVFANNNSTLTGMTVSNTTGNNPSRAVEIAGAGVTITNNTITSTNSTAGDTAFGIQAGGASFSGTISGNTVTATNAAAGDAVAISITSATVKVTGNSLSASGGANSYHLDLDTATITAGSTGNVPVSGTCNDAGNNTGQVSFTIGTTCP